MFNGRPASSKTVRVNKRTGRVTAVVCNMDNECLACIGNCKGYERTADRMAPLREAYRLKQAELRRQREAQRRKN